MHKHLKLCTLFLLITTISFAQQSIVVTTRSNIKDKNVVDTTKKSVTPATQAKPQSIVNTTRSNIKDRVVVDSTKAAVTTTEKTNGVVIPGVGLVVKHNGNRIGTTNEKGELEIAIKEKGDYIFILSTGGTMSSSPTNTAAKSQGGPVKGVKVALGGNGCCVQQSPCCGKEKVSAITNDKGEVGFQNLEPGSYLLMVHAATGGTSTKMGTQN